MPYLKFDREGKNTGSCGDFCKYMEKEDKLRIEQGQKPESWLNQDNTKFETHEVRYYIDLNKGQLGKNAGKYGTGSINPTLEEWKSYGKTEGERKANFMRMATKDVTDSIIEGFGERTYKGEKIKVQRNDIHIFFKFEENRYYKGTDEEVKQRLAKSGQVKPGHQKHAHFIVAFKTKDDRLKISTNDKTGKHFNRNKVKIDFEKRHDKTIGFNRNFKDSYEYKFTMKHGTFTEKTAMLEKSTKQELLKTKLTPQLEVEKQLIKSKTKTIDKGLFRGM